MIKRLLLIPSFILFLCLGLNAQVTIFDEDFETATGAENIANGYLGWQNGQFDTSTNNNYFWVFDNTRCNVISGGHSLAVSTNTPATTGILPQYDFDSPGNSGQAAASTYVYHTTPIDATNYINLTIDFNWICEGETILGLDFDYGTVLYSLDANTWTVLPGTYAGQNSTQSVTNLDLSALDGQVFYLGFGWENDEDFGGFPSFIIDDIDVKGVQLTPCITPTQQPSGLNLTPTGDSINGTFTAATPNPDNFLVVISTSATPPNPVDGTTYNIGDTVGAGYTVVDTDNNTTFTATGLTQNTQYYIYIFSYNSTCVGGPLYYTTNPLNGSTTTTTSTYCTPSNELVSFTSGSTTYTKYIDDVQFMGTLNDVSNLNSGNSVAGYTDWTGLTNSVQAQGKGINVYVEAMNGRGRWKAWVDWDKDSAFDDTTEEVYDSGKSDPTGGIGTTTTTFSFVIPANQSIGDYRIRIRFFNTATDNWSYDFDACEFFDFWNDATGNPNDGDFRLGEAEDYLFTVVESCAAQITSITDGSTCGPGPATLQVSGNAAATVFNLYDAETGGNLVASNSTGTFTPNITTTTEFWVTASDGNCESLKRLKIIGTLNPVTNLTINTSPNICGETDIVQLTATGDTEITYLIDEDFEAGGLGVFTGNNIEVNGATFDNISQWQNQTSIYEPQQSVWNPAISSGFGSNHFAISTSDSGIVHTENELVSPGIDASTFTSLSLELDMYFSKYYPTVTEYVNIEISTDGGTNWNIIDNITTDVGSGTEFSSLMYDLTIYAGSPSLTVRIYYYGDWGDGVAVDNIQLYGSKPLAPSFTWSAGVDAYLDANATIPYVAGTTAPSVYIKPTLLQLEQSSFTFTAFATLSNGCIVNRPITLTNNTKVWKGLSSLDWNNPNNWRPYGVPTSDNCVIIDNIGAGTDSFLTGPPLPPIPAFAKNVTILDGAILEIESQTSLTITDWLNVEANGLFYMKNNSSLIQVNDVTNTGNIFMERAPANGGPVNGLNYVYWSSPTKTFNVGNISPGSGAGTKWKWDPTTGSTYGNWIDASSDPMTDGQGYIVRGLSGVTANPDVALTGNSALFSGEPNNGDISRSIEHGGFNGGDYPGFNGVTATNDDDNWNLIGNPYPSAIWADSFLERNAASSIANDDYNNIGLSPNQKIIGTIWVWPHAGIPNAVTLDPFYDDFGSNYDSNQYIAYNFMGSTTGTFQGYIASGQAFFVLADHNNAAQSGDGVFFHNRMRDATFTNSNFLRPSNNSTTSNLNHHRIWLNLVDSQDKAQAILVGYAENATNGNDNLFDGPQFTGSLFSFYSLIDNDRFAIQGRTLPFTDEDTIPLGMVIPENDIYKIAINQVDGLFENETQDIFLEDTYTNTIHNLRMSPYSFTSEPGTFNDRFIIRYTNNLLNIKDFNSVNGIKVFEEQDVLVVKSDYENIESIKVYDILGRSLFSNASVNGNRFTIKTISPSETTLFLKIKLVDGKQKITKVIF